MKAFEFSSLAFQVQVIHDLLSSFKFNRATVTAALSHGASGALKRWDLAVLGQSEAMGSFVVLRNIFIWLWERVVAAGTRRTGPAAGPGPARAQPRLELSR